MRRLVPLTLLAAFGVALALAPSTPAADADTKITWKKTVLDTKFRSEGVAVADVNKDGKIDVLNGEYWYEAPDWKAHELQPFKDHAKITEDGLKGYSRVFACWTDDFNGDGFADLIVIDFPGAPCYWMENPKGKATGEDGKPLHWKKHIIWHSACNETPLYTDLVGNGKRVLVMGLQPKGKETEGQMAYFTPDPKDPTALWEMHPISEPSAARQGSPRHAAVQPRARRRRPQRRRPQRRDLHRRVVGAADEGRRQDRVEVPPGQPRRGRGRHVRLRRGRRRQGRRAQLVARTSSASGGTSSARPTRTGTRPSRRRPCSRSW